MLYSIVIDLLPGCEREGASVSIAEFRSRSLRSHTNRVTAQERGYLAIRLN